MISREALTTYLCRREKELSLCRDAINKAEWETVARIGHKIAGNAETFGFSILGEIGKKLEACANRNSEEEVAATLDDLETFIETEFTKLKH